MQIIDCINQMQKVQQAMTGLNDFYFGYFSEVNNSYNTTTNEDMKFPVLALLPPQSKPLNIQKNAQFFEDVTLDFYIFDLYQNTNSNAPDPRTEIQVYNDTWILMEQYLKEWLGIRRNEANGVSQMKIKNGPVMSLGGPGFTNHNVRGVKASVTIEIFTGDIPAGTFNY